MGGIRSFVARVWGCILPRINILCICLLYSVDACLNSNLSNIEGLNLLAGISSSTKKKYDTWTGKRCGWMGWNYLRRSCKSMSCHPWRFHISPFWFWTDFFSVGRNVCWPLSTARILRSGFHANVTWKEPFLPIFAKKSPSCNCVKSFGDATQEKLVPSKRIKWRSWSQDFFGFMYTMIVRRCGPWLRGLEF